MNKWHNINSSNLCQLNAIFLHLHNNFSIYIYLSAEREKVCAFFFSIAESLNWFFEAMISKIMEHFKWKWKWRCVNASMRDILTRIKMNDGKISSWARCSLKQQLDYVSQKKNEWTNERNGITCCFELFWSRSLGDSTQFRIYLNTKREKKTKPYYLNYYGDKAMPGNYNKTWTFTLQWYCFARNTAKERTAHWKYKKIHWNWKF